MSDARSLAVVAVAAAALWACGDPADRRPRAFAPAPGDTVDAGTRLMLESVTACQTPDAACDSLFALARRIVLRDGAEIEHDSLYPPPWQRRP